MRRRGFIKLIGGTAGFWSFTAHAHAQQFGQVLPAALLVRAADDVE
jgi:hypothetical protein